MTIRKHEIPILEYDDNPNAVIMPEHEQLNMKLPKRAVFAFLYDAVDRYARENGGTVVGEFVSATKNYPVYVVNYREEDICLMQAPVGAAAAVQILDWLIGYGVEAIISAGSCGVLRQMPENRFLIPTRALRDEGTSYHYAPPSRYQEIHPTAVQAIRRSLQSQNLQYETVTTWSTDGFYRETAEKVNYRVSEGCSVVEMECSALAACAQLRGAVWGELLYTADSLANVLEHDCRNWGEQSRELALRLCLEAVRCIPCQTTHLEVSYG